MINHEYKKTKNEWPVKSQADGVELTFSGSFSEDRISNENIELFADKAVNLALWVFVALGFFSLAFVVWMSLNTGTLPDIFDRSYLSLSVWVAAFSCCYLWAKRKQQELDRDKINLLNWSQQQAAEGKKASLDIYEFFSPEAKRCWNKSFELAKQRSRQREKLNLDGKSNGSVTALDLLSALLEDKEVILVFMRLGINIEDIKTLLSEYAIVNTIALKGELLQIPFVAFSESVKLHNRQLDPLMLLCALAIALPQDHFIQAIFFNINLSLEDLEIIAAWVFNIRLLREDLRVFKKLSKLKPDNEINKGLTSLPSPYLDHFSQDLTFLAKNGALPLALGRGLDLHEIFSLVSDGGKNIIIKGPKGSGRTTVVNELAYKMATEQVPEVLQDKRLVKLETSAILGNSGKAENVLVQALKEAENSGNIILVIEDMHDLARTSSSSGLSLLELLVNFLENSHLLAIGTTTLEDYTEYLRDTANFDSTFVSYELSHLSHEGIMLACCVKATLLEGKSQCFYKYQAIKQAVETTDLYVKGADQPQKAISVLVEAATRAKNFKIKIIGEELIQKIVSERTHIPSQAFNKTEAEKLLNLEQTMAKYIVGQSQAVKAIAEGLRRSRSGLTASTRPLASFLFLGPTGVGKTEIAKTLARVYFGQDSAKGEQYLLRLDMSEYRGQEGLGKLLGNAGSSVDTALVKHLKNYPFCLLLLDEFEKASPEILNIFLEVLEDGRLTTGKGETLDVTHALIIATSNAGTKEIQEGIRTGLTLDQIKTRLFNQTLTSIFPPELLNRFDSIILFNPLSREEVQRISFLQLEYLREKLKEKGIKLEFSQNIIDDISKNAYDPLLGARPIRRYIQDHVEGFISKLLLGQKLPRGSNVTIDLVDGELVVK